MAQGLWRLKRPREFRRCYRQGRAYRNRLAVLHVVAGDPGPTRVGFSVSRKVGKATVRNRVKRLLREAVRRRAEELGDGVCLVVAARVRAREAPSEAVFRAVDDLLERAGVVQGGRKGDGR